MVAGLAGCFFVFFLLLKTFQGDSGGVRFRARTLARTEEEALCQEEGFGAGQASRRVLPPRVALESRTAPGVHPRSHPPLKCVTTRRWRTPWCVVLTTMVCEQGCCVPRSSLCPCVVCTLRVCSKYAFAAQSLLAQLPSIVSPRPLASYPVAAVMMCCDAAVRARAWGLCADAVRASRVPSPPPCVLKRGAFSAAPLALRSPPSFLSL